MEFYPLDEDYPITTLSIGWNHTCEVAKILEHKKIINLFLNKTLGKLFTFIDKQKLRVGSG